MGACIGVSTFRDTFRNLNDWPRGGEHVPL